MIQLAGCQLVFNKTNTHLLQCMKQDQELTMSPLLMLQAARNVTLFLT